LLELELELLPLFSLFDDGLFPLPGLIVEGLLFVVMGGLLLLIGFGGVDGVILVGQFAFTFTTDPSGHFLVVSGSFCLCRHDGSEGFVLQSTGEVTLFFSDEEPPFPIFFELDGPVALIPGHVPLED
jgi:hypothetical protein